MSSIHTGWQPIADWIGVCKSTAKKYHYECGMPILRLPGYTPVLVEDLFVAWLVEIKDKYPRIGSPYHNLTRPKNKQDKR